LSTFKKEEDQAMLEEGAELLKNTALHFHPQDRGGGGGPAICP
jgi:hypothetical protein